MESVTLPSELFIQIINFALGDLSDDRFGRIGHNAAWKMPRPNALDKVIIQDSILNAPISSNLHNSSKVDQGDGNTPTSGVTVEEVKYESKNAVRFYAVATTLRL
ncbi:hypothetical protein CPB86DRAFT_490919 [Serendipita vermifera]|nr:hypothetical protein CPB86DRAFT_490919 [Serendipita vermifera]